MHALSALALLGFVAAQTGSNSNGTASSVDIQVVQANFQNAQLVPQFLPSFVPQGTLGVTFAGQSISIGQNLSESTVSSFPTLAVSPASTATRINTQSLYTVAMIDADIVGTNDNTTAQTRHWLVNTVMLQGTAAPYSINYTGSTAVTNYVGPGPAAGSGPHRYVLMLYAQSSSWSPPANLSTANVGLGTMFWEQYVESSSLGPLVAANYFQVENGVATVTPVATSAVNTATLSASVSSASASSTGATAVSASSVSQSVSSVVGATTASSSSSAAATSKAAAGRKESFSFGYGAVIGVLGVLGTLLGAGLGL